jgi:asparagine synthase (glutamine-hydrolysing)
MCGLSGEITFDEKMASLDAVRKMSNIMTARGPDAAGTFAQGRIALGHRRLKIIDLSERAQQPMCDSELGLTIVFNGCIYNHRELRRELEEKGYRFFSDGDTEVILKSYHAWGEKCVERLSGMFAFAVHERDTGRVVIARDRLGIKPLYLSYSPDKKRLRFASSLPAILAAGDIDTSINPVALHHYLSFHAVVPPPHTILNGVSKLPPATVAVIEPDGTRRDTRYWKPVYAPQDGDATRSYDEWEEMVGDALRTAVSRRMLADVPVGILLSGGLDSSLIVGLLAELGQSGINTFSVGFEAANGESGDEFQYSDIIAKHYGTRHHKMMVESSRVLGELPKAIAAMSEPMVSYDNIGFYLLSEEVTKHVKVVQSGQGADEVFAGYHWYPPLANATDPVATYERVFFDRDEDEYAQTVTESYRTGNHSHDYVAANFSEPGADAAIDKVLRIDSTIMLVDDPVKRVDNMTMAHGFEARVPFLDHDLVELAARVPAAHKIADGGKGILKSFGRRIIPNEVIDRPKGYFPVPALKYLEGPYLSMVQDALNNETARNRGIFQRGYVDMLLQAPKDHITPLRGSKLWQVALLELWLQTNHL